MGQARGRRSDAVSGHAADRRRAVVLALVAGAVGALCWLPTGIAPLLPLCFFFMGRALRHTRSRRDAVVAGTAFGIALYAVGSHFLLALLQFSWLAVAFYGASIASILPASIAEAWGAVVLEEFGGLPRSLGFGVIYVLFEKLRTTTEMAFPADLFAHAFGKVPEGLGWAPWIGQIGRAHV